MNDNIINLNVANFLSVGLMLVVWALVFVIAAQVYRRAGANEGG